ncbi:MAG: hypothetical protein LBP76_06325 [Treponema sp.]|nr:hypothetical protein [Treponema sp.]
MSKVGGIHFRTSGGSGGTPYAVRSAVSKETEQASVAGLNHAVGKEDEYIFEVVRTTDGYTTSLKVSKTGEELATAAVPYADGRVVVADTPVFAGFALMAVEAEISQIKVWEDDFSGDPVFHSPDSTPRPVPVAAVKIGIQGENALPEGSGTAEAPQTLIKRLGDVQTAGIQLKPVVSPAYADELGVDYYLASSPFTNDSTITVNQTTGLVNVAGPGTATIQMISRDTATPEAYLTIIVTPDYVPVGDFTVTAAKDSIVVDLEEITLSTDIPETVTDPVVVWTTSDSATVVFVEGESTPATVTGPSAKIKGLKAGSATITATATTTAGDGTKTAKTATKTIAVEEMGSNTIFSWSASEDTTFALSAPVYISPEGTILSDISGMTAGQDYFTLVGRDSGITATKDGIVLAAKRFNIGTAYNDNGKEGGTSQATTEIANVSDGQFNFSRKVKITIQYSAYTGSKPAYLYINNNTASGGKSVLGSASAKTYTPVATGGLHEYILDPADFSNHESLSRAFIQLRAQSDTSITITGITIEYATE